MNDKNDLKGGMFEQFYKAARTYEFREMDRKAITKFSDKELALWQSGYPPNSPQYIFAEHEWQRRLTVQQVRGARFAAYIGILGTIIGSILTLLITG